MVDAGDESGVGESDEWVTGEAPTLEESSTTVDETTAIGDFVDDYLPYWVTWDETYYGMGIGFVLVLVAVLAVSTLVTCSDSSRLSGALAEIERAPEKDTHAAWTEALERARSVRRTPPGGIRSFFHTFGFLAPGRAPAALRREIGRVEGYTASVVADRFGASDARDSRGPIDSTPWPTSNEGERPGATIRAASRTHDLVRRGEYADALRVAGEERPRAQGDGRLLRAHLEAALAAGRAEKIASLAQQIDERESSTNYDRYLLLRSAPFRSKGDASRLLEAFDSSESGAHTGVRLEEMAMLHREGKYAKAKKIGEDLLGKFEGASGESAGPEPVVQVARLRNRIGLACAGLEKPDCVAEQFKAARNTAPGRGDIHATQIQSFLDRGAFEQASEGLAGAFDTAGAHDDLLVARARLDYLRGRFDDASAALDRVSDSWEAAPVLRARIRLALDDVEGAAAAVADVPSSAPDAERARALEQLADARAASEVSDGAVESMAKLTADSKDPIVLRSAARMHLHAAKMGGEETHFEKAKSLLDRVESKGRAERGPDAFLRCEVLRAAGEWEAASEACARGRRANPDYLPGMLTAVRLRLETQQPDSAARLAARLSGSFDNWEVAKARVETAIRTHELGVAEKVLEDWGTRRRRREAVPLEFAFFNGRVHFARAEYAAALEDLEKAADSESFGDEADVFRAHALVRLGRFEPAEQLLDDLTDLEAWKGPAWAIYGELRRRQEEVYDALENLRIAKRHYDDRAPRWRLSHLYAQFAMTWQQHRDWSDSRVLQNLETAREEGDPRSPEYAYVYGLYLLAGYGNNSEPDRAIPHLERVVELQPSHCGAVDALHTAYEEVNDWAGRNDMRDLREEHCSG